MRCGEYPFRKTFVKVSGRRREVRRAYACAYAKPESDTSMW